MFPSPMAVLTMLILIHFLPPIHEYYHWIKHVGIRIGITKVDADYGIDLSVP